MTCLREFRYPSTENGPHNCLPVFLLIREVLGTLRKRRRETTGNRRTSVEISRQMLEQRVVARDFNSLSDGVKGKYLDGERRTPNQPPRFADRHCNGRV